MQARVHIFWFRRDLRLDDNAALFHALKSGIPVVPVFIFDRNMLDLLEDKTDRRLQFIHTALQEMQQQLNTMGSSLEVYEGRPAEVFKLLLTKYKIDSVFANHDYEPYANQRDQLIKNLLQENGIAFHTYKDQVILEKGEVLKDDEKPYYIYY